MISLIIRLRGVGVHFEYFCAFISLSCDQLSLSGKFPLLNSSCKALGYISLPGETLATLTGTYLSVCWELSVSIRLLPRFMDFFYLPRLLVTASSSGMMSIHLCIPVAKHWACNWRLHKWPQLSLAFLGGQGEHNCLLN